MKITINNIDYTLPATLTDVTLLQRIEFDKQYGKDLKDQLTKIIEMKDGIGKELEFTDYHLSLACKTLSFFGNVPMEDMENTHIEDVMAVYHSIMNGFSEDVDFAKEEFELGHEFFWKDEKWVIQAPELNSDSKMTFGEFLDAKQNVKNLYELGEDKWGALLALACVYFRKEGEKYHSDLSKEGGERYELLKELPLEYALHIGFFMRGSLDSWLKIYHSSATPVGESADLN